MTGPGVGGTNITHHAKDLSLEDFLAHAYVIELEAWERYRDLADQMTVHNNPEVAELFDQLGEFEHKHSQEILARMETDDHTRIKPWEFVWAGPESPESIDFSDIHYRMTAFHALRLALAGEERAHQFFRDLSLISVTPKVRELAAEFAEDEQMHIEMVQTFLAKQPLPGEDWDDDPDPPEPRE